MEADLDFKMMCLTSSSVNSLVTMGTVGRGGSGIHGGRVNDFGVVE